MQPGFSSRGRFRMGARCLPESAASLGEGSLPILKRTLVGSPPTGSAIYGYCGFEAAVVYFFS